MWFWSAWNSQTEQGKVKFFKWKFILIIIIVQFPGPMYNTNTHWCDSKADIPKQLKSSVRSSFFKGMFKHTFIILTRNGYTWLV